VPKRQGGPAAPSCWAHSPRRWSPRFPASARRGRTNASSVLSRGNGGRPPASRQNHPALRGWGRAPAGKRLPGFGTQGSRRLLVAHAQPHYNALIGNRWPDLSFRQFALAQGELLVARNGSEEVTL